jgi:hypothetical protein
MDMLCDLWIHGLDDTSAHKSSLERLAMLFEKLPGQIKELAFFKRFLVSQEQIEAEYCVFVWVTRWVLAAGLDL